MADYEEDFEDTEIQDEDAQLQSPARPEAPPSSLFKESFSTITGTATTENVNETNLFDFLFKKRANSSVASSTKDFYSQIEVQTDLIPISTAWSQRPCYSMDASSGHVTDRIKRKVNTIPMPNQSAVSDRHRSNDLNKFLNRSSNLILGMLGEETHRKNVVRAEKSKTEDTRVLTDQVTVPTNGNPLFTFCEVISLRTVQDCAMPLFLLLHNTKGNAYEQTKLRTCISGWNGFSPFGPLFVLGVLEQATCTACFAVSNGVLAVVAGVADGSLACWNLRESFANGTYTPESDLLSGAGLIRLPGFLSCDSRGSSHTSSVVDIVTLQRDLVAGGMEARSASVVSLDDSGIMIIWNVVDGSGTDRTNRTSIDGITPTLFLVKSKSVDVWKGHPNRCMVSGLYANSRSISEVFVASSAGHLLCVPLQSSQAAVLYGNNPEPLAPITAVAFSPHFADYFLVGHNEGRIRLFNKACRKHLAIWSLAAPSSIVNIAWSDSDPKVFYSVDTQGTCCLWKLGDKLSDHPTQRSSDISFAPDSGSVIACVRGHHVMLCTLDHTLLVATFNRALDKPRNGLSNLDLFNELDMGGTANKISKTNGHIPARRDKKDADT